jgi:hypothetical protein
MQFTPEALKELEAIIEKKTEILRKKIEICEADIRALRALAHKGQDE